MSTETAQDEIIEVKEAMDGSAVVDLPDNIPNPQIEDSGEPEERDEPEMAAGGEASEDDVKPLHGWPPVAATAAAAATAATGSTRTLDEGNRPISAEASSGIVTVK